MTSDVPRGQKGDDYDSLFNLLPQCITLSCSSEGIDSLLCSVFFEPEVPCNLIGAYLLGVTKAVEPIQRDPKIFASLMAQKSPKISPLWLATIWKGQTGRILKSALGGLPPISLPAASWTGTVQSFLQAKYLPVADRPATIPRAREYSIQYLVRPDIRSPFTPSPPFGTTGLSNLSLEVKAHLEHDHRPILCSTIWILQAGEGLLDPSGLIPIPQLDLHLPSTDHKDLIEETSQE